MRRATVSLFVIAAFAISGGTHADPFGGKARNDQVDMIPDDDPAMAAAVRKARATLPAFLDASRHPQPGTRSYAVKVGLGPAGRREFFWLDPFTVTGDDVSGRLANTPEIIPGYQKGDTVKLPLSRVTDWMYVDNGAMKGNYSACALLSHESPAARAMFERQYGFSCAGK